LQSKSALDKFNIINSLLTKLSIKQVNYNLDYKEKQEILGFLNNIIDYLKGSLDPIYLQAQIDLNNYKAYLEHQYLTQEYKNKLLDPDIAESLGKIDGHSKAIQDEVEAYANLFNLEDF
jgi:hypothetical protein